MGDERICVSFFSADMLASWFQGLNYLYVSIVIKLNHSGVFFHAVTEEKHCYVEVDCPELSKQVIINVWNIAD